MPPAEPVAVFHAGFHKTGTTSLQAALRLHTPQLAPLFAVETRHRSPALLDAAEAARTFSVTPDAGAETALTRALNDWAAGLTLPPGGGLLVSCEDFSGHMPGRHDLPDYRAAVPIACVIDKALRRHLPHLRLRMLYTTREAEAWLRSVHWQLSKREEMVQGARRFARRFAAAADFAPLLARLRAALPETPVQVADLADQTARPLGPVEALYDAAGLPDALRARLPQPPHINRTPPHDLARLFVKLNRSDLPREEVHRMKRNMLAAETLLLGDGDLFAVHPGDDPR